LIPGEQAMSAGSKCRMSHMPSTPAPSRKEKAARRAGEFPPAPEPLAVPVFDSHTHLDITVQEAGVPGGDGGDPVEALLAAAAKAGVDRIVQVGVDEASSRWGAELAARHPAVLAAVALHPNDAPLLSDLDESLRVIEALAAGPRVRGVGETGLDTFRTPADGRAAQETSFRAHIAIAKRHGKARRRSSAGPPSPATPSSPPSVCAVATT
jgi:TatD DNase family protein